jgi:hypothetical protein
MLANWCETWRLTSVGSCCHAGQSLNNGRWWVIALFFMSISESEPMGLLRSVIQESVSYNPEDPNNAISFHKALNEQRGS